MKYRIRLFTVSLPLISILRKHKKKKTSKNATLKCLITRVNIHKNGKIEFYWNTRTTIGNLKDVIEEHT